MLKAFKKNIWQLIHTVFKIKLFEKILLLLVKGKYTDAYIAAFIPPHRYYKNPTYRTAKKGTLRLHANLHDYNDWKAYWGLKEKERENLYALAANAKTVIDIGTNNAWVLMNLAKIIEKNNGFVYGFEPHPNTFKRCLNNIKKSNLENCKVFNMGCGEADSELQMIQVIESNSGQNRIVHRADKSQSLQHEVVSIKVTSLDKQFENLEKIDLIKIDVEGFEMHVLRGADNLLRKHKPVIFIEINDPLLQLNNTSGEEVISFLKSQYNYSITNALTQQAIDKTTDLKNLQIDVICTP
ncbi:MAG: FkbM family methyltransferase [Parafilimonas sp.]|nr:FkbM family methyltransferase [Parafilimonas sp.]